MNIIKVGIIGTGSIAEGGHMPAINSSGNAKLTAVLSRSKEKGQDFLDQNSASDASIHNDINSFINDSNVDLAIICSPDGLHFEHAKNCITSGKHVLIEKPMTTNVEESEQLIHLAKTHNRVLATGFHLRHHAGHIALLDKIHNDNAIGDIQHIRAIWAWPQKDDSNWRARGDLAKWWSLSAIGTHCFDMTRWISKDFNNWSSIKSVVSNSHWNGPHDETAVIAAQLSSGITAEIVSSVKFGPYNRLEVFGSSGTAICHSTFGRTGEGKIWINDEELEFEPVNPFLAELQDVIHSIENNMAPTAGGETGLRSVKDLFAVLESAG